MDHQTLKLRLTKEEGSWSRLYDDATGRSVKKGDLIQGNLTLGVGRNLFDNPLSPSEIDFLLDNDVMSAEAACMSLPFWAALNPNRQVAVADMIFNIGITRFLKFPKLNAALQAGNYAQAAAEVRDSLYYRQVGYRAEGIARTLETGVL